MTQKLVTVCLAVALVITKPGTAGERVAAGDAVIYRKKLGADREIVAVRGPSFDVQRLRGLVKPHLLKDADKGYHSAFVAGFHMRLELRSRSDAPLALWTRLVGEPGEECMQGFDVLDIAAEPNFVYMATTEVGEVFLWRLNLVDGTAVSAALDGSDWNSVAAVIRRDRSNTRAVWGRSPDGRLTVEVGEQGYHDTNKRTLFERAGDEWRFRPVTTTQVPGVSGARPDK